MQEIREKINQYRLKFEEEAVRVRDRQGLEALRVQFLGRKRGYITKLIENLKHLSPEERPLMGKEINELKTYILAKLEEIKHNVVKTQKKVSHLDLTLPGRQIPLGAPHPLVKLQEEIESIFYQMGFSVEDGPEIETDYYNFEALNFPPHHPARDDWDTIYVEEREDLLLRTHTSPVQIRAMEKRKPPIRIIIPGRVYRKETPDPTHLPMFFQVEGLVVDVGITFAHLKGTLESFLRRLFSERIKIRFRPSFFPFTEPSAEVDISCLVCQGKDSRCRVCRGSGWIEILGAGMVDPQVLKNVNIDPEKFSGFAFGMGIDRTAMFVYQINDMRLFYENDLRLLRQFNRQ